MSGPRQRGLVTEPVALPGDRTLRVRHVQRRDLDALTALFGDLDETDLYRRFFQAHLPPRRIIEAMTTPGRTGGVGLVAEVLGPDGSRRLVGEAAYAPLPDGDGELAITVVRGARGWLGPYLLDLVARAAAERGVANLQADVLCENRRMLALVQARGYATMGHSTAPAIARVVVSTTRRVPSWPAVASGPRVLVEAPGGRWHAEAAAKAAGLDVLVCPGPEARWARCPALDGVPCPLAAGADVIVDSLDPSGDVGGRLLRAHEAMHAAPVHVDVPRPARRRRGGAPARPRRDDNELALVRHVAGLASRRRLARQAAADVK